MPHRAKAVLVQALGMPEHQVRVIAPDVGGGFGPKAVFHPEELAIPAAAMLLRRPIKWIEDRLESFTGTVQERDQIWDMEAAADAEGRLLAIRGRLYHDHGAEHALWRRAGLQRRHQSDRPLRSAGLFDRRSRCA